MEIIEDVFGVYEPEPGNPQTVQRFTMKNSAGFTAQVITYGATLTTLQVPGRGSVFDDVTWGFDTLEEYLAQDSKMGATVGRTANRIRNGQFTLDGVDYQLTINDGESHLHGGISGFDKQLWKPTVNGSKLTLTYLSQDGEEGYPGNVLAQVTYEVTAANELSIEYNAMCTSSSPVGFTNHAYYNLSGHQNSTNQLVNHYITIYSDSITETDENFVTTGKIVPVEGTIYDLQTAQDLRALLQQFPPGPNGFNENYCLFNNKEMVLAARVEEREKGRVMEVYTNQAGLQLYTSNHQSLTDPPTGKDGAIYAKHGAFCLEGQNYPDAVNHDNFPNAILRPGSLYSEKIIYRFLVPLN